MSGAEDQVLERSAGCEALIEAGIALSRATELDDVLQEIAHQLRRVVRCERSVIALADGDSSSLRVAHRFGYESDGGMSAQLERRLARAWGEVLRDGELVVHVSGSGVEMTAPMVGAERAVGAVTIVAEREESAARGRELRRAVTTLASQAAAAVERAWRGQRAARTRRIEAIGEVAAGIAHELRNPLFGISSAAQLLRFRAREDPVLEKNAGRILREVERLNRMATSLLEYAQPPARSLSTRDPDAVWDEVLDDQRGRLESRSIAVVRTRATPHARCSVDAEQLAQAFVSVLANAIDAAPEASDLTLSSTILPGGTWQCRLHNPGPPIPPELLPRVFEVFFSTKAGSAGIGLALAQRIIEAHHGTIAIESSAESGTTVTIDLPGAGHR